MGELPHLGALEMMTLLELPVNQQSLLSLALNSRMLVHHGLRHG